MYTVKQLSTLAEISVRTLHHYDEIGVLKPTKVGENGYRYYDDAALLRLQQILFYREIGLELGQIKAVLDQPGFDRLAALRSHREVLQEKVGRLHTLINTVDATIMHLEGKAEMSKRRMFEGFSEEKQKEYEREIRLQYGSSIVTESVRRWADYTQAEKDVIFDEGNQVYTDIVAVLEAGKGAQSAEMLDVLERWHDHLRYFYEPTLEILRGLGALYNSHPDFIANFSKLHAELPAFLESAITHYVDVLETAEIERLLAEDEAARLSGTL